VKNRTAKTRYQKKHQMIVVTNLSIHFSGNYIFEGVSFKINNNDKIGLVGKNGAGKTTLMRILKGELSPENGEIAHPKDLTIGYLPQEIKLRSDRTIIEETLRISLKKSWHCKKQLIL